MHTTKLEGLNWNYDIKNISDQAQSFYSTDWWYIKLSVSRVDKFTSSYDCSASFFVQGDCKNMWTLSVKTIWQHFTAQLTTYHQRDRWFGQHMCPISFIRAFYLTVSATLKFLDSPSSLSESRGIHAVFNDREPLRQRTISSINTVPRARAK